eukprot:467125-Prymnesium_polylepis.1
MTSTTGTLSKVAEQIGDENIHVDFAAGSVSNIRIRGVPSNTAYAWWTGTQWEGQHLPSGAWSMNRYDMEDFGWRDWKNNDGTYAELNLVPPSNATQLGLLNGDGNPYILVELTPLPPAPTGNSTFDNKAADSKYSSLAVNDRITCAWDTSVNGGWGGCGPNGKVGGQDMQNT